MVKTARVIRAASPYRSRSYAPAAAARRSARLRSLRRLPDSGASLASSSFTSVGSSREFSSQSERARKAVARALPLGALTTSPLWSSLLVFLLEGPASAPDRAARLTSEEKTLSARGLGTRGAALIGAVRTFLFCAGLPVAGLPVVGLAVVGLAEAVLLVAVLSGAGRPVGGLPVEGLPAGAPDARPPLAGCGARAFRSLDSTGAPRE
jgi:hypothetical protein